MSDPNDSHVTQQAADQQPDAESSGLEQAGQEGSLDRTDVLLDYASLSRLIEDEQRGDTLALFANRARASVRVEGSLHHPLRMRDALETLYRVVKSDTRRAPKDRTAYLAHARARQGASAGATAFQAQRDYFDWLDENDSSSWFVLDPIITAHPDRMLCEVFSKDEGSYACLSVDWEALELKSEVAYGTTNIDFSESLFDSIKRMRSFHDTALSISSEAVSFKGAPHDQGATERRVQVPNSWLRGLLQVQASATLPSTKVVLAPIDLYNVLHHLRLNADLKKGGRAVRVELTPGEPPRLVIEPRQEVVESSHGAYQGRQARVIRIWGRRRWMMLTPLLAQAEQVELHLLGTGLPSFCVLRCGALTFTLGLTGFTAANWSQAIGLDTLLPRTARDDKQMEQVLLYLEDKWFGSLELIASGCELSVKEARQALQTACQHGQVMFDLAEGVYRLRPLLSELDLSAIEFRNPRERLAHDLMRGLGGSVTILSRTPIPSVGVQYVGEVDVEADRRQYRCEMTIDEEGRVRGVKDTSPFFHKHQLKEGPSAPLIALRLKIAEAQREHEEARAQGQITHETRVYVRRHRSGEQIYQIALDGDRVRVKFGDRSRERLRAQHLAFNAEEDARCAYLKRIEELEEKGYMDATVAM